METIELDLQKRESQLCTISSQGQIIEEGT